MISLTLDPHQRVLILGSVRRVKTGLERRIAVASALRGEYRVPVSPEELAHLIRAVDWESCWTDDLVLTCQLDDLNEHLERTLLDCDWNEE